LVAVVAVAVTATVVIGAAPGSERASAGGDGTPGSSEPSSARRSAEGRDADEIGDARGSSGDAPAETPDGDDPADLEPEPVSITGTHLKGPLAPSPAEGRGGDLAPVEPFGSPALQTPQAPPVLDVLAGQAGTGGPGGLTSNAPGCASRCITSATISFRADNSEVHFAVDSNVPARFQVYLSTATPAIGPSGPFLPGVDPISNGRLTKAWERTIGGLAPGRTHHLVLTATDANGATQTAVTSFRAVGPGSSGGDLAPAPSCAFQCISSGVVHPGTSFDRMRMEVRTTVPATLQVAVSTSAPGSIAGTPVLNPEVPVAVPQGPATSWDLNIGPLQAETTYHALVRATDAQGRTTHRIGSFRTGAAPPTPYRVTLHRVNVAHDGDPGNANRGELRFFWGFVTDRKHVMGSRPVQKMRDGDGFDTAPFNTLVGSLAPDQRVPTIVLTVVDDDADGWAGEVCHHPSGLHVGPLYTPGCDERTAGAETGALDATQIAALPKCTTYGFIGEHEDERCKLVDTGDHGVNYARVWTIVSYRLG
jgi:hypothetical protein